MECRPVVRRNVAHVDLWKLALSRSVAVVGDPLPVEVEPLRSVAAQSVVVDEIMQYAAEHKLADAIAVEKMHYAQHEKAAAREEG